MHPPAETERSLASFAHGLIGALTCAMFQGLLALPAFGVDRFFTGGEPFAVPPPSCLLVRDLNGDGRVDAAVAHRTRGTISVLLGRSESVFAAPISYETGLGPSFLVAGELNGDNSLDLFVLNSSSSSAAVLTNKGAGIFELGTVVDVGPLPQTAVLADFDEDGALDAAIGSERSGQLRFHFGDGQGGFRKSRSMVVGGEAHHLVAGDFDADGHVDLVDAHRTDDGAARLSFLGGRGDGTFELEPFMFETAPLDVVAAPIDDRPGFALLGENALFLFLGVAGAKLELTRRYTAADGERFFGKVVATDVNEDGETDYVVMVDTGHGDVVRALGRSSETPFAILWEFPVGTDTPSAVGVADFDGDGQLDLLLGVDSRARLVFHRGIRPGPLAASGPFAERKRVPAGLAVEELERFDLNVDGAPDFVVRDAESVSFLKGDGRGAVEPPVTSRLPPVPSTVPLLPPLLYRDMVPVDIDGDGKLELALSVSSGLASLGVPDPGRVVIVFLDDSGVVASSRDLFFGAVDPAALAVADFNGDAMHDLVITDRSRGGFVFVLFGSDLGLPVEQVELALGAAPTALETADFNADGATDIAVSTDLQLLFFFGDGQKDFAASSAGDSLAGVSQLLAKDVNGDGAMDLIAFADRTVVIAYAVRERDGELETIEVDSAVRSVDARDLDGDGLLELAIVSSRRLSVYPNGPDGFALPQDFSVGGDARGVLLEDLDADGRLEAIVPEGRDEILAILPGAAGQPGGVTFRRGDADLSGGVNLSDALVVLGSLFAGTGELNCEDAADFDDDGALNLTDPVALLSHLFAAGPDPAPPGPVLCGRDPTPDDLRTCSGECR